jgi:hypothetical protein
MPANAGCLQSARAPDVPFCTAARVATIVVLARHSVLGIRHSAFGIRHSAFGIRHSAFGIRCSVGGARSPIRHTLISVVGTSPCGLWPLLVRRKEQCVDDGP